MTEVDWGSEANEAPKAKKRIPTWAWFCGGGCLLAIVAAIAMGVFFFRMAQETMDPEKQWASLGEYVPFDERPEGQIIGFKVPFQDIHTFAIPRGDGTSAVFLIAGGSKGEDLRAQYFDGEKQIDMGPILGNMGRFHVEEGVLSVQGRELRSIRFTSHERAADGAAEKDLSPMHKSTFALDLTKEGSDTVVILQYDLTGSLAKVDETAVVEFLKPFHIGPKR
jgi:hypothetical protein